MEDDDGLDAETDLVETVEPIDPEEFQFFLSDFERRFLTRRVRLRRPVEYIRALWRWRGFELADLAILLDRSPRVQVERLTVSTLCDIGIEGKWPDEWLIPPEYFEWSDRRSGASI